MAVTDSSNRNRNRFANFNFSCFGYGGFAVRTEEWGYLIFVLDWVVYILEIFDEKK